MNMFDVIIIGGGASGFAAAKSAISRNLKVAILDMGATPLRKVAVSGGGKCNFTNLDANYTRYFGNNPDFVRSALSKITPNDVLEFVSKNNIKTFQKTYGQFFVDGSSQEIINALLNSVKQANIFYNSCVNKVEKNGDLFAVYTDNAVFNAKSVIIATGGLSYSVLGVSDAGFKIAKSFGHKIVPMRPALCGIKTNAVPNDLSGVSMPVKITVDKQSIYDNLLFTHFGLGGPAIYKSTVRNIENGIVINFMPDADFKLWIKQEKQISGKRKLSNVLAEKMPVRVAKWIARDFDKNIADLSDKDINGIYNKLNLSINDIQLHNMNSAEVMRGGVDVHDISSKTMESKLCKNLFFAGEVMDIAGDLGGFNLHWAWASGTIAGLNV